MVILFLIITYIILRQTPAKEFADRRVLKILRKFEQVMRLRLARRGESKKRTLASRYYIFWIAAIERAIRMTRPSLEPSKEDSKENSKKENKNIPELETSGKL